MTDTFDLQPTLVGELVMLRGLQPDDRDPLYEVARDPLIWEQHPANRHEPEVFDAFFRESLDAGGALLALDVEYGRVIGSSRYHGLDPGANEVEIGWTFLARSRWGGRYNREMKKLMLDHAFRFVDRVVLIVGPGNIRSQKAVEKIGGVRAGDRPDASGRASFLYEIRGDAWRAREEDP